MDKKRLLKLMDENLDGLKGFDGVPLISGKIELADAILEEIRKENLPGLERHKSFDIVDLINSKGEKYKIRRYEEQQKEDGALKESSSIIQNAVQINGVILSSTHVHDYQEHNGIMVDGGLEYLRRGYPADSNPEHYDWLDVSTDTPFEIIKERLIWGTTGKDRTDKFKWVKLIDCETGHLHAILKNIKRINKLHKDVIKSILRDRWEATHDQRAAKEPVPKCYLDEYEGEINTTIHWSPNEEY